MKVVRVNNKISDPFPQGSILGPMLFGVYVNDLPSTPKHCLVESYVDDTKLYMSFQPHDSGNIVAALNEDLVSIRNWCFENGLLLNPDKTKLIIYGSTQMTAKKSLVFSKLYSSSSVWANTTDTNIKRLQGIQNYASRIVFNFRKYMIMSLQV